MAVLRGVHAVPMLTALWPTYDDFRPFTTDGVHFNSAGKQRVADYLGTVLPH